MKQPGSTGRRRDGNAGGEDASDPELLGGKAPERAGTLADQAKDDEIGGRRPRDGEAGTPGRSVQPREGAEDKSGEGDEEKDAQKGSMALRPDLPLGQVRFPASSRRVEEPIAEVNRPDGQKEGGEPGGSVPGGASRRQVGGEQQRPAQCDEGSVEAKEGGQQGDGTKRGDG